MPEPWLKKPQLILLDEPFSHIDNFKKNGLRRKLFNYLKEKNITAIVATHDKEDALSFADKLIVLKETNIVANNSPVNIYSQPPSHYVASLFDDSNEVTINNQTTFYYPHQIKVVEQSAFQATVIHSYFKGSHWLIEVNFNRKVLYINHTVKLQKDVFIYLHFD